MRRHGARCDAVRRLAAKLAALLLAGCLGSCVGDGAPRTAVDREKPTDTCQHTSVGGEARTVCY